MEYSKEHNKQTFIETLEACHLIETLEACHLIGTLEACVGVVTVIGGGMVIATTSDPEYATALTVGGGVGLVAGAALVVDSVRRFNNVIKDLYKSLEGTYKKG